MVVKRLWEHLRKKSKILGKTFSFSLWGLIGSGISKLQFDWRLLAHILYYCVHCVFFPVITTVRYIDFYSSKLWNLVLSTDCILFMCSVEMSHSTGVKVTQSRGWIALPTEEVMIWDINKSFIKLNSNSAFTVGSFYIYFLQQPKSDKSDTFREKTKHNTINTRFKEQNIIVLLTTIYL